MVTINLTEKQLENLKNILNSVHDEGQSDDGWASDELKELRYIIDILCPHCGRPFFENEIILSTGELGCSCMKD